MRPGWMPPFLAFATALLLVACTPAAPPPVQEPPTRTAAQQPSKPTMVRIENVRASLSALAADSMEGRATATTGSARAARFIADELRRYGVAPAGDSAYFQRVPLAIGLPAPNGRRRLTLRETVPSDTVPMERRTTDVNVVGMIPGTDPSLRDEAIVVGAHFDHLGIGRAVNGDSIYNGADDDASGVVATLEIARALAQGPPPKRTVIFVLSTGEETGLLGTRWYIRNPVVPIARTVANLQIEMIGRPDSLAGGQGRAWLTGYERSTMGAMLTAAGIPVVADPRPSQNFFERSDNIAFARLGIPAHTLSSYGMHSDYHTPADEVERVDFEHMAQVIDAAVRAVRLLANGEAPAWNPGGQPAAAAGN